MHTIADRQRATLATAIRTGYHWTQAELDRLRTDEPVDKLAVALGRTLYAVYSARRVKDELEARAPRTATRTLPFDRGFTDIEALFND